VIDQEWARCAPWLQAALDKGDETFSLSDVRKLVDEGRAQFWPGRESAGVSDVVPDFHIWLFGGRLSEMWAMERACSDWARAQGCRRVTIKGRPGWSRVLKPLGYREETALVKDL
jgi:hypothetical protein